MARYSGSHGTAASPTYPPASKVDDRALRLDHTADVLAEQENESTVLVLCTINNWNYNTFCNKGPAWRSNANKTGQLVSTRREKVPH